MKSSILIQRVYEYCDQHWNDGRQAVAKHFMDESVPKATIYRLIKSWEAGLPARRQEGSGRKAKIMTKRAIQQLQCTVNNKHGISTRRLAKKFKCHQSYVVRTLQKTDIKFRKRIAVPARTEKQLNVIRPRCGRLFSKFKGNDFVIDDESYFTFANTDKNSNGGFWTTDISITPNHVKFKKKKKFEQKILVWVAISPCAISQPFIAQAGLAINAEVYLKECIVKRLIPFIKQHYSQSSYVFWPDLASAHYAKKVIDYLTSENVVFVAKNDNPPCVPELRPIEHFWSILKGFVYEKGWEATSVQHLTNRIKQCFKKVDQSVIRAMVMDVPKKLDRVRRFGVETI